MGLTPGMDDQLIERARAGDRQAQQVLWNRHRRWVATIVLAHKPRSVEVDDLMQDVAVKLISKITTLRDPAAFRPWLRQIALNLCRGAARDQRPTLHLAEGSRVGDDDRAGSGPEVTVATQDRGRAEAERKAAAGKLLDQVLTLPPEYREPLLLRCLRSMTYQQIGEVLELPVTTVETRLARARRMLREELGDRITADGFACA